MSLRQFRLREVFSSFLIGFIVSFFVFQPYFYMARADIGSSINGMVSESVNYAPPTFKEMGERGYVGFGSLSIRQPDAHLNIRPFSFTPPFVKKGCGAIDIAMGGFNFLGFDYLVQKLQQILQAAPAFAFQLALEVFVPQVSQVLSKVNAIADMINNINFDACKASTTLVQAVLPSVRDMIFNSRTDQAAQNESRGSGSFWNTMANVFNVPPMDEIRNKFNDLINSFRGYNRSSFNPIKLLGSKGSFSVFGDKIALNNPEYAPRGSYLRFTGNDEYNLKTAFIGDLNITLGRDSNGSVVNVHVPFYKSNDGNIGEFVKQVNSCVDNRSSEISNAVGQALQSRDASFIDNLNIDCTVRLPVRDNSSSISFDVGGAIVKPVLSSLVKYYLFISDGTDLDQISAKWINFIASIDSAIVRSIRVAALAGGDSSAMQFLGKIVSADLVKAVTSQYVLGLVDEGCSEMQTVLVVLSKELEQVIPASSTSGNSAASQGLLDGIKNEILSSRDDVLRICSDKRAIANQNLIDVFNIEIYSKNRDSLIKLAENLEQKLVQNLNSRGLSTLARYVRVGE